MSGIPYLDPPYATNPTRSIGPIQPDPLHQHGVVAVNPFAVKHAPYTDRTSTATSWDQASFDQPSKRQRVEKPTNVRFVTQRKWKFPDSQKWIEVQPSTAKAKGVVRRPSAATAAAAAAAVGRRSDDLSPRQMPTPETPQFASDNVAPCDGTENTAAHGERITGQLPSVASDLPRYMTQQLASNTFRQALSPLAQAPVVLHQPPTTTPAPTARRPSSQQSQPVATLQIQTSRLYDDNLPPTSLVSPMNAADLTPRSKSSPSQALSLEKDGDRIAALIAEKRKENEANLFRQRMLQKQLEHQHQKGVKQVNVLSMPAVPPGPVVPVLPVQRTLMEPKPDVIQSAPLDFTRPAMDFPSPLIPGRRPPISAAKERGFANLSTSAKPIKQRPSSSQGRKEQATTSESPPHQNSREVPSTAVKAVSQPSYQAYPVSAPEHRSQPRPSIARPERRPTANHRASISAATKHRPAPQPASRPESRRSSISSMTKASPGIASTTNHSSHPTMALSKDPMYLSRNSSSRASPQQIPGSMPDMWNMQDHQMQYVARALGDTNERNIVSAPSTQMSSPAMSKTAMTSPPQMQISRSQQGNPSSRQHAGSMSLPPQPPNTPFNSNMSQPMMAPSMHAPMAAPSNCFPYDVGQSSGSGYYYGSAQPQSHLASNPPTELATMPPNAGTNMTSQLPQALHPARSSSSHIGAGNGGVPLHNPVINGYSGVDPLRKEQVNMFSKGYTLTHASMGRVGMTGG